MVGKCTQEIQNEFQSIPGIGLTTHAWTSSETEHYVAYTVHYITKNQELKSKVLSTDCIDVQQTAENIASQMKITEQKWGLDTLSFQPIYVHDNAANVTKDTKNMDPARIGIGCLAHTINLAANSATSIEKVSVLLKKARVLVKTFKKSHLAAAVLKKKRQLLLPDKGHKLILSCPTRWNSSYDMLERLNEQSRVSHIRNVKLHLNMCRLICK